MVATAENPIKHHHAPAFYLSKWAGADGQVCQMRLHENGRVSALRKHPNATGFVENLYTVSSLPDGPAQAIETRFMKPLDGAASRALNKIVSGDTTPWDSDSRSAWTRFILSLMFRHPEAVNTIKNQMRDIWDVEVKRVEDNYQEFRWPNDPATFEEFYSLIEPAGPEKSAMNLLQRVIDNQNIGPTINDMRWHRHVLIDSEVSLVTSDRPVEIHRGLGHAESFIALPITPRMLFIAAHSDWLADKLVRTPATKVAKAVNLGVVARARRYVWGTDDSQLAFVQKHFGRQPDREIISDKQKREALIETASRAFDRPPHNDGGSAA